MWCRCRWYGHQRQHEKWRRQVQGLVWRAQQVAERLLLPLLRPQQLRQLGLLVRSAELVGLLLQRWRLLPGTLAHPHLDFQVFLACR